MALFSKRHYEFLAKQLLDYKPNGKELATYHRMFVYFLASKLKLDNSKFDTEYFIAASGAASEYME